MSLTRTLQAPPARSPAVTVRQPGMEAGHEYTIGEAADLSGLSEHTLRYYERAGLLEPVRRQRSSRHRRYSGDDVARLRTLACLRAAGMPLARMRRYFELLARGAGAAPLQLEMLVEQREVLQSRRQELDDHVRYLGDKIAYWQALEAGDPRRAAEIASRLSPCSHPAARHPSSRHS